MELGRDIEIQILAILRYRKHWDKFRSILQPGFFTDEASRHIFTLFQKYFSTFSEAKKISIVDIKILVKRFTKQSELKEESLRLARLIKKADVPEPKFIEETMTEFAQRQTIKTIVMEGLNILEAPEFNTHRLKEYFHQIDVIRGALQQDFISYFHDKFPREEESKVKRVSTGLEELDKFLRGGYEPGELFVVLAPPERGKTMALVNLGFAALVQGLLVFHATHEISPQKVMHRYDLRIAGMDADQLQAYPDQFQERLTKIKQMGGELIIKDYCDKDAKIEDLNSAIITYISLYKRRPDLIIVDYADLLSSGKNLQERFELKEIYKSLRRMAQALKVPIITASQTTRMAASKLIITMEDFAEAYSKAAIADIVIALCQTPEEEEDGLMRIHVCKNRRRPGHPTFRINVDANRMCMWSIHSKKEILSHHEPRPE